MGKKKQTPKYLLLVGSLMRNEPFLVTGQQPHVDIGVAFLFSSFSYFLISYFSQALSRWNIYSNCLLHRPAWPWATGLAAFESCTLLSHAMEAMPHERR